MWYRMLDKFKYNIFDTKYIYLIELLCSQYGTNDRITQLVNSTDIFIIPSMNPDGMFCFVSIRFVSFRFVSFYIVRIDYSGLMLCYSY